MKNEEEPRKCAVDGNKDAVVKASLDNAEIKNIDNYRITSGLFNVTYPSDSVIPTNSNFSQAVSDGWFIMLEPLKPGQHEIKFSASQVAGQTTGENTGLGHNISSEYYEALADNLSIPRPCWKGSSPTPDFRLSCIKRIYFGIRPTMSNMIHKRPNSASGSFFRVNSD